MIATFTTFIGSNYNRKVLLGILLVIISSFTLIHWKESMHDRHNERGFKNESFVLYPDILTVGQLMEYLKWPDQKACDRVGYYGGVLIKFDNMSFFDGQKAICLKTGIAPQVGNCIVYSIGINNEWSFDETMEKYGCHVGLVLLYNVRFVIKY